MRAAVFPPMIGERDPHVAQHDTRLGEHGGRRGARHRSRRLWGDPSRRWVHHGGRRRSRHRHPVRRRRQPCAALSGSRSWPPRTCASSTPPGLLRSPMTELPAGCRSWQPSARGWCTPTGDRTVPGPSATSTVSPSRTCVGQHGRHRLQGQGPSARGATRPLVRTHGRFALTDRCRLSSWRTDGA